MSKTAATASHADLNEIIAAVTNLRHLLDRACLALGELDYGTGASRNHELDRAASLVDVSRTMSEALERDMGNAYPALVNVAKAADTATVQRKGMPQLPTMDFTDWTILDFELAVDGWIRMEHAIGSLINQPRANAGRDYHAGAAFFRDFQDDWAAFQLDRIVKHLRSTRFDTVEDEQRRVWLIVRFAAEYPDEIEDLLVFATSQLQASK
ncbi:hypothetical protein SAMN05216358_4207 [Rhizobium sp. AN5]|uniref:hypothetical protein n=1 Tax=Rhizobium sp. AN5 TaxID=1855304 RepID=UPI000BCE4C3E|nr:hypothetical protein [Rhizobium sp. AN5]SOC94007.1 hypothetical protein SAMN05216358_4207 [Rhizobium sp. AN5]